MHKRVDFSKSRYDRYDTIGKRLGNALLTHTFKNNNNFIVQPIVENKNCGDISVLNSKNGKIKWFEIEVRSAKYFNLNYNKAFDSLDIPMKKFHLIPNGIYLVFDESEENNTIPTRFMAVNVEDILVTKPQPKRTKFNTDKDEYFYKIPYSKVKFCKYNEEKQDYDN